MTQLWIRFRVQFSKKSGDNLQKSYENSDSTLLFAIKKSDSGRVQLKNDLIDRGDLREGTVEL